jgi:hypothetical protein
MRVVTPPRRRTGLVVALVACILLGPLDTAAGQRQTPTPSADELWNDYPLHASPEPGARQPQRARANGGQRVSAPAARSDTGDGSALAPLVAGLVVALGAFAMLWTFRPDRGAGPRPGAPPADRPRPREPRAEKRLLNAWRVAGVSRPVPPDPQRPWTAEVDWAGSGTTARFTVLARSGEQDEATVVAQSAPLAWPPTTPSTFQALTDAVAELERALLYAGWTPLSPGSAWYAKRFAWKPAVVERPAPRVVDEPRSERERSGRFLRRPAWAEGTDDLWRCEVRWDAGMVNSRFEVVVYEPGERRGRTIGESATFKWLMMADPDPAAEEYRAELHDLTAALAAAGWERVERGAKWYSARFVWRRAGAPPDVLEPHVSGRQAP